MSQRNLERFPWRNQIYNLTLCQKVLLGLLGQTKESVYNKTMGHKNPVKGEKNFDVIRIGFKLDI